MSGPEEKLQNPHDTLIWALNQVDEFNDVIVIYRKGAHSDTGDSKNYGFASNMRSTELRLGLMKIAERIMLDQLFLDEEE